MVKSSNPTNLRLIRPDESPKSALGESIDDRQPTDDLGGLEAWLLHDGLLTDAVEEVAAGPLAQRIEMQPGVDSLSPSGGWPEACGEPAVPLSARLEAVLRGAAEGLDCDAAALYTLDAATTELAMRSMWGLAPSRLIEDARPLRGAIADLEAMCGRAVVLEDDTMNTYWRVPEPCAAAVCLPIATSSTVLGTLWFFCESPRQIGDKTTNLMEIVAGRLAVELELEELRDAHREGLWAWTTPGESIERDAEI